MLKGTSLALAVGVGRRRLAADTVEAFYRGKTLSMVIGLPPVGTGPLSNFYRGESHSVAFGPSSSDDYDIRGRLLARHLGRHIPGAPTIVPRNMPGAGGIVAANWLAREAPRDGTALLMLSQGMPLIQALGDYGVALDVRHCPWIGSTLDNPNVVTAWHASGIETVADAKARELIMGATWHGSETYCYPAAMNALLGTRFRIILGYVDDTDLNIAMERGEISGRVSSWEAWKAKRPNWILEGKIDALAQSGLVRHPELPHVPLLSELAGNEDDRAVLRFLSSDSAIARSLVTTPETPAERVVALRQAFDETMKDPAFLAEAAAARLAVNPVAGETAQEVARTIVETPAAAVTRARAFFSAGAKMRPLASEARHAALFGPVRL